MSEPIATSFRREFLVSRKNFNWGEIFMCTKNYFEWSSPLSYIHKSRKINFSGLWSVTNFFSSKTLGPCFWCLLFLYIENEAPSYFPLGALMSRRVRRLWTEWCCPFVVLSCSCCVFIYDNVWQTKRLFNQLYHYTQPNHFRKQQHCIKENDKYEV